MKIDINVYFVLSALSILLLSLSFAFGVLMLRQALKQMTSAVQQMSEAIYLLSLYVNGNKRENR